MQTENIVGMYVSTHTIRLFSPQCRVLLRDDSRVEARSSCSASRGSSGEQLSNAPKCVSRGSEILSLKKVFAFFDGPFTDATAIVNSFCLEGSLLGLRHPLLANANAPTMNKAVAARISFRVLASIHQMIKSSPFLCKDKCFAHSLVSLQNC